MDADREALAVGGPPLHPSGLLEPVLGHDVLDDLFQLAVVPSALAVVVASPLGVDLVAPGAGLTGDALGADLVLGTDGLGDVLGECLPVPRGSVSIVFLALLTVTSCEMVREKDSRCLPPNNRFSIFIFFFGGLISALRPGTSIYMSVLSNFPIGVCRSATI